MEKHETHGLGYGGVDDDPNVAVLLATMDATGGWEATRRLRAWEREHLDLQPGQRLLDVGCGLGDAALSLAAELGRTGEIVGIDRSTEMIAAATSRAGSAPCHARFTVGDAQQLDEPGDSFDVVRSERTLQWLPDPESAVAEMARVLRRGGLISLIDTDWSTFDLDVGDDDLRDRVRRRMRVERGRPSNVGRRLTELVGRIGFDVVAQTEATQHWSDWNPDETPAPVGCFSISSLGDDLVDAGELAHDRRPWFVSTVERAARNHRFSMDLTMFAVVAREP
jgi:SAM-dependent methyltransferase